MGSRRVRQTRPRCPSLLLTFESRFQAVMRTGLGAWFTKDVSEFLKHGHRRVGSTFGSIADVVINNSTSYFSDNDIDAIAAHLQSLPATSVQRAVVYDNATADALRNGARTLPGAVIYASDWLELPWFRRQGLQPLYAGSRWHPGVLDEDPPSLINVALSGSVQRAAVVSLTPTTCRNSGSNCRTRMPPMLSPARAIPGVIKPRQYHTSWKTA
jgi:hypothetical protein